MGMGEKPVPFKPEYRTVRDDVLGREFAAVSVRSCPHPQVIKRYGTGGVANVSVYTCKKCRFHEEFPLHYGVGCAYGLAKNLQAGT